MIINRYIDFLKALETSQEKEIKVTKDLFQWLKDNIDLKVKNKNSAIYYGFKIVVAK